MYILEKDKDSTFKIFFKKTDFLYGLPVDTCAKDTYMHRVGTQRWRVLVC